MSRRAQAARVTSSETTLVPTPVSVAAVRGRRWPGLLLAGTLGGLATWVGVLFPVVGGPVIGIVLGVLTREVLVRRSVSLDLGAGARFASKQVLQAAVVLLGLGLSLTQVVRTGRSALPVMLGTGRGRVSGFVTTSGGNGVRIECTEFDRALDVDGAPGWLA